jgi:hypothetical protein
MAGEQRLQRQCRDYATNLGCVARKIRYEGRRDAPDLFIGFPGGNIIFFELKNPNKKGAVSKGQRREIELLRSIKLHVYIIDNFDAFKAIVDDALFNA